MIKVEVASLRVEETNHLVVVEDEDPGEMTREVVIGIVHWRSLRATN